MCLQNGDGGFGMGGGAGGNYAGGGGGGGFVGGRGGGGAIENGYPGTSFVADPFMRSAVSFNPDLGPSIPATDGFVTITKL